MKILLFLVVLACVAKSGLAQGREGFESTVLGGYEYFYSDLKEEKTETEADVYCKAQDPNACLAMVVPTTFSTLVRWLPENSKFWIDGKLDPSASTAYQHCAKSSLDLSLFPFEISTSITCLFIDRMTGTTDSKIKAQDCGDNAIPLCSINLSP